MNRAVAVVYIVVLLCGGTAEAEDVECDVEATVASAHVWRGLVINDETVFQPSATVRAGDFSFNVWGTWDLTNVEDSPEHTRVDVTAGYAVEANAVMLGGGVIAYLYPDSSDGMAEDTGEVFLGATLDTIFLPSLSVYYDFVEKEGFYADFMVSHSLRLVEALHADCSLSAGLGGEHYNNRTLDDFLGLRGGDRLNSEDPSLVDLTAVARFPYTIGEHVTVTPKARYTVLLDSDIRDAVDAAGRDRDHFVVSLTLTAAF
jgi:hypothetical protein